MSFPPNNLGIAHRDIKPDNVLLADPPATICRGSKQSMLLHNFSSDNLAPLEDDADVLLNVKLIDFGLAVIRCKDYSFDASCGTPKFMG